MHAGNFTNAVQLRTSSARSVQTWNTSVPGGVLDVARAGYAAGQPAAAGGRAAQPTGPGRGVESSSYIERCGTLESNNVIHLQCIHHDVRSFIGSISDLDRERFIPFEGLYKAANYATRL